MRNTDANSTAISLPAAWLPLVSVALLAAGCASVSVSGGSGMPGGAGGGVSLPGGGSSGGGMPGGSSGEGSSGGGMPGGSSGGGSSGGGMPGGSMPGGSSGGGSSGGMPGGSSGGSSGSGGSGPMESVQIPGGSGAAEECDDGGVMGGGIGGGMGCDGDQAGDVGQFPGGGDAERAEQLGKELDKSVGDFDEVLMEEQREIETVSRDTEGYGTGSKGSGGTISLGEQSAGAQSGSSGGAGGGGGAAGSRSDPLEGMSEADIEKRTPDDIAVIMDDDIVAKQLREAALAEQDPELRERLWEEYRKYKGM